MKSKCYRSVLTASAMIAVAGTAHAQCGSEGKCGIGISYDTTSGHHYTVTTSATYIAVNACISGNAVAAGVRSHVPIEKCFTEFYDSNTDDASDSDCGNLLSVGSVSLTGVSATGLSEGASVTGSYGITSGARTAYASSYYENTVVVTPGGPVGTVNVDDWGIATGTGSVQWVLATGTANFGVARGITPQVTVDYHPEFDLCEESGPDGPRTATVFRVDFAESILKSTPTGSATTTWPIQGAIIYYTDGNVDRLGAFLDSSLDPVTENGVVTIDGEVGDEQNISQSAIVTTTVELTERHYSLLAMTGDADDDGYLSHCDRVLIHNLDGATIGDGVYDLRSDVDLDGDVDEDDLYLATSIGCPGDYNCDGVVDFADYLAFMNDYEEPNSNADINFDTVVDFSDYLDFLTYYETPCP